MNWMKLMVPDNIWIDFYLDPWVYFMPRPAGGWQMVHILFYREVLQGLERGEKPDLTRRLW